MLGKGGCFVEECLNENYIGVSFGIEEDLTGKLSNIWQEFNKEYIPVFLKNHPEKTKIAAGLACGFLWTICKGLNIGDIVLSPNSKGSYYIGEIISDYYYVSDTSLPHRRNVRWFDKLVKRSDMSEKLRRSIGSIGTCCDVTPFAQEIEILIKEAKEKRVNVAINSTSEKKTYFERDLHRIFCNYLQNDNILGKTIYQEKSNKSDSSQKWIHPDIVGVKFESFLEDVTQDLQKTMEPKKTITIYSYELKRVIENDYQLKQYFFQALSNSNWANYGYLVAYEIEDDLMDEISRLNSAFGVGVILLKAKIEDTKILFQAKEKELDYITIDKLCRINPEFKEFISDITKVMNAPKEFENPMLVSLKNKCDKTFDSNEDLENYCKKNCIPF